MCDDETHEVDRAGAEGEADAELATAPPGVLREHGVEPERRQQQRHGGEGAEYRRVEARVCHGAGHDVAHGGHAGDGDLGIHLA
jgi:hypothetical protein